MNQVDYMKWHHLRVFHHERMDLGSNDLQQGQTASQIYGGQTSTERRERCQRDEIGLQSESCTIRISLGEDFQARTVHFFHRYV